MSSVDSTRLEPLSNRPEILLTERNADGYWTGELSASALATAAAVAAGISRQEFRLHQNYREIIGKESPAGRSSKCGWRLGRYDPESQQHFHHALPAAFYLTAASAHGACLVRTAM